MSSKIVPDELRHQYYYLSKQIGQIDRAFDREASRLTERIWPTALSRALAEAQVGHDPAWVFPAFEAKAFKRWRRVLRPINGSWLSDGWQTQLPLFNGFAMQLQTIVRLWVIRRLRQKRTQDG